MASLSDFPLKDVVASKKVHNFTPLETEIPFVRLILNSRGVCLIQSLLHCRFVFLFLNPNFHGEIVQRDLASNRAAMDG